MQHGKTYQNPIAVGEKWSVVGGDWQFPVPISASWLSSRSSYYQYSSVYIYIYIKRISKFCDYHPDKPLSIGWDEFQVVRDLTNTKTHDSDTTWSSCVCRPERKSQGPARSSHTCRHRCTWGMTNLVNTAGPPALTQFNLHLFWNNGKLSPLVNLLFQWIWGFTYPAKTAGMRHIDQLKKGESLIWPYIEVNQSISVDRNQVGLDSDSAG